MGVHKLANGPVTLTISEVRNVEGNFGPQMEFTDGTTSVYVNEMPAQRGLARLGIDAEGAVGRTITFVQVKKDGKTFTNLEWGSAEAAATPEYQPPRAGAPAPAAPSSRKTKEEMYELYGECVAEAVNRFGAQCDALGLPYSAEALQSSAATLFIQVARL